MNMEMVLTFMLTLAIIIIIIKFFYSQREKGIKKVLKSLSRGDINPRPYKQQNEHMRKYKYYEIK